MMGAGKYNKETTALRKTTDALGVITIVIGGIKGDGFEVQVSEFTMMLMLPDLLRQMADGIEADLKMKQTKIDETKTKEQN